MIGIYCFTVNRSGFYADCPLIYIGQSKRLEDRIQHHVKSFENYKYYKVVSESVRRAVREYQNYSFCVLEECAFSELDSREQYYLSLCTELQRLGKLQLLNKHSAPRVEYQIENALRFLAKIRT